MRRFLLLSGFILMGALPCKSQDVIVLRGEQSLTGRVLWEKSKGDSLFYNSAVSTDDSLLLFVPRRRVEYVISADNDERMLYKGKSKGWQPWQGRAFNEVPQQQMLYGFFTVSSYSRRAVRAVSTLAERPAAPADL